MTDKEKLESYRFLVCALLSNLLGAYQALGGPRDFFYGFGIEPMQWAIGDFEADNTTPERENERAFLKRICDEEDEDDLAVRAVFDGRTVEEQRLFEAARNP